MDDSDWALSRTDDPKLGPDDGDALAGPRFPPPVVVLVAVATLGACDDVSDPAMYSDMGLYRPARDLFPPF